MTQNPGGPDQPDAGNQQSGQQPAGGWQQPHGHQQGQQSGQGWPPQHPQGRGPGSDNRVESKNFVAALFDFSFQSFITVQFAKFIYIILLVFLVLGWLFWVVAGFAAEPWIGLVALLLGWIPAVIYLILIRIMLEFYIAMVRTSQNTAGTRVEVEALRWDLQQRR